MRGPILPQAERRARLGLFRGSLEALVNLNGRPRFQRSIAGAEARDYLAAEAELNNLIQVGMVTQAADCESYP